MAEQKKADVYIAYLEQILAGEEDIGPVEDVEIAKLLLLAKTMLAADFSVNSKTRAKLRQQILDQISKNNKSSLTVLSGNDDELNEEDLEHVNAAGFAGQTEEQKDMIRTALGLMGIKEKGQ